MCQDMVGYTMETEASPTTDNYPSRSCVTCNERNGTVYQMRVRDRDGTYTDMDLKLCDRCLASHRVPEWIELLDPVE